MDLSKLDAAVGRAVCGWLNNGGSAVLDTAVLLATGIPQSRPAGLVAGLGLLALKNGCSFNPDQGYPGGQVDFLGCRKCSGPMSVFAVDGAGNQVTGGLGGWTNTAREILKVEYLGLGDYGGGSKRYAVTWIGTDGNTYGPTEIPQPMNTAYITTSGCAVCLDSVGQPGPGPLPPVDETTDDGCDITVNFESWLLDDAGNVQPIVKIEPKILPLAGGGIIGGCNFSPIIYIGGGSGGDKPPWWAPWAPGPDGPNGEPWWYPLLRGAAGGFVSAAVGALLDEIFGAQLDPTVYRLTSVCETGTNGGPVDLREVVIPRLKILQGIAARVDALPVLDQGLKDFKQPICPPDPPAAPVGRNISIQFRSDGPSPYGEKRLRKVFRYRDPSLKDLAEHVEHWKDFEWESGPWMVISEGLPWGKPQVWAKSEEEGRRVLTHAAQIAGVDLTSRSHRWRVHEAVGYRERPVMRMKVHRDVNGRLWIAERTGSAGPPMVLAQGSPLPGLDH